MFVLKAFKKKNSGVFPLMEPAALDQSTREYLGSKAYNPQFSVVVRVRPVQATDEAALELSGVQDGEVLLFDLA